MNAATRLLLADGTPDHGARRDELSTADAKALGALVRRDSEDRGSPTLCCESLRANVQRPAEHVSSGRGYWRRGTGEAWKGGRMASTHVAVISAVGGCAPVEH